MKSITIGSEGGGSWGSKIINFLLEKAYPGIEIKYDNTPECDVIVRSVFEAKEPFWNEHPKPYIYWSGEPLQVAETELHTKCIHIDTILDVGNSIYYPFAVLSPFIGNDREYTKKKRDFCLAYCSQNKVKEREEMFNLFMEKTENTNKICHALGKCCGNYKRHKEVGGGWASPKLIEEYSNYTFVIAMENQKAPGFVTEKIINAYVAGAIPIYWGDSMVEEFFNKASYIDVSDFDSFEACVDHVLNLDEADIRLIVEQPFYNKENKIINIYREGNIYWEACAAKLKAVFE